MIIRSIRLKNIKCYGEGPDGNGVTIRFEPGINRIAGKNGHGKSTLIESLGYALFLTEPVYEEKFEAATYLLRAGKKAGEIDVTFDYAGRLYRLERGVGQQNKRRPKVLLAEDGSTEAEGETEVCNYLCRLFGFANPERFSELFSKLVGVKQGRLTWPFDSKPTEARKHFEPLLDVEIFRQCFNELKPVLDHFDALKREHEQALAVVEERLRERADSPEKARAAEQQMAELEVKVNTARTEKAQADQQAQVHEEKERACLAARNARDVANSQLKLAVGQREASQTRLGESEQACQTLAAHQSGYEAFTAADQALRGLQDKQREKSALAIQHTAASNAKTEWEGKARAARDQVKERAREKESAELRARELRQQAAAGEQAWLESQPEFKALARSANAARQAGEALNHWLGTLAPAVTSNTRRLAKILAAWNQLAAWDPRALDLARADETQAEKAAHETSRQLSEARQIRATLAGQLAQITGGVCPFLKEQCRQFDPAKIGADLAGHEKVIVELAREQAAAEQTRQQARALRENLSQQEARLAQLRASLRDQAEAYVQAHHQLYPPVIQEHFQCLRDYLRSSVQEGARLSGSTGELLPLPAELASGHGVPPLGGETFNPAPLQKMDEAAGAFCREARAAITALAPELAARLAQFEEQHRQRVAQERDWQNQRRQALESEANAGALAQKITQQNQAAAHADAEIAAATARLQDLEARLTPYASLEAEVQAQQKLKDQFVAAHQQYLGAKANAEKLAERQAAFAQTCAAERQAEEQARLKQAAFETAQAAFDPATLAAARKAAEDAGQRLAGESAHLQHAERELKREQQRLTEWRQASQQQMILRLKIDRLRASLAVTQRARYVLKDAAPLVAQHVCRRIAAKAQRIFNQINPEPVELEWNAERYSLRIDPGERRFAMLSGGEQTKLALAMTLAMIQEFSRLKCCVFDEPTYGVDADSRQKLADAIVALQDLTEHRLDQLLLVSHDDAFEGKIEHGIVLKKVAGTGTDWQDNYGNTIY